MIGKVIRVVEAPLSLSITVARKGAVLAGRVAGWALTGIANELLPGRQDETEPSAADEYPSGTPSTSTWEPEELDGTQEPAPLPPLGEEPEAVSVTAEELDAVAVTEEEPAPLSPTDEEREAAKNAADEETAPSGATETETSATQQEAPSVSGGEEGAVVEHEPGIGTSVRARDPHSALNNPVTEADLTEWPDPYDHREDPLDPGEEMVFGGEAGHPQTGATSTSEPHPSQDPEA